MDDAEELTPTESFPLEAFPDWARDYIDHLAHVLQVDPTVIAMNLLGTVAVAVQSKADLYVRNGWTEQLAYWVISALRSGNRKTPALMKPMAPILEWQKEQNHLRKQYRRRLRERCDGLPARAPDRKRFERLLEEAEPPDLELFGTDLTPEALAIALHEQNESYAIVTAEPTALAQVLGGLYQEATGAKVNMSVYLSSYTGEPVIRRRVRNPGAHLERPALSMVLIGQRSVFDQLTGDHTLTELGFVARMNVVIPRDLLGEREVHDDAVPDDVADTYRRMLRQILATPPVTRYPDLQGEPEAEPPPWPAGALPRHRIELEPEAIALLMDLERRVEPMMRRSGLLEDLSDFGGKLAGQAARSAALLHVLHHPVDWLRYPVSTVQLGHAIEMARYQLGQILSIWGPGAADKSAQSDAQTVLAAAREFAAQNPDHAVTRRELQRALIWSNGRGKIRDAGQLAELIDLLVERGDLTPDRTYTRGSRWVVTPTKSAR